MMLRPARNGLGLLEKRAGAFEEALARFRTALDCWARADYAYGVAAVYANLGTTYLAWAHRFQTARLPGEAARRFQRASEWLERCIAFSAAARLGRDTSEAYVALAQACVGLGQVDRAWSAVSTARSVAAEAGNEPRKGAASSGESPDPSVRRHGNSGSLPQWRCIQREYVHPWWYRAVVLLPATLKRCVVEMAFNETAAAVDVSMTRSGTDRR